MEKRRQRKEEGREETRREGRKKIGSGTKLKKENGQYKCYV